VKNVVGLIVLVAYLVEEEQKCGDVICVERCTMLIRSVCNMYAHGRIMHVVICFLLLEIFGRKMVINMRKLIREGKGTKVKKE